MALNFKALMVIAIVATRVSVDNSLKKKIIIQVYEPIGGKEKLMY